MKSSRSSNENSSSSFTSLSSLILRYLFIPVPAGISLPMITFSFIPINGSILPLIAASVRTFVVSWKDAADRNEFVARDAFVIPSNTWEPTACSLPSSSSFSFSSRKSRESTMLPGRRSESPFSSTRIFCNICRTITSICLSLISTPCRRYTRCTSRSM